MQNYTYIKSLEDKTHLLYSKERATYEVWAVVNKFLIQKPTYPLVQWRNTWLMYTKDYYPITPLEEAVITCNEKSIEWAKKEIKQAQITIG